MPNYGANEIRTFSEESEYVHIGPTQVKCRHLISSIFDAMDFQHSSEMLEFNL